MWKVKLGDSGLQELQIFLEILNFFTVEIKAYMMLDNLKMNLLVGFRKYCLFLVDRLMRVDWSILFLLVEK